MPINWSKAQSEFELSLAKFSPSLSWFIILYHGDSRLFYIRFCVVCCCGVLFCIWLCFPAVLLYDIVMCYFCFVVLWYDIVFCCFVLLWYDIVVCVICYVMMLWCAVLCFIVIWRCVMFFVFCYLMVFLFCFVIIMTLCCVVFCCFVL